MAAGVAGLDPSPTNVQPGQFGTVFKELLDGNVTHMQLRRQRVFLLHSHSQLLKNLCEEDKKKIGISYFIYTQSQLMNTDTNKCVKQTRQRKSLVVITEGAGGKANMTKAVMQQRNCYLNRFIRKLWAYCMQSLLYQMGNNPPI